MCVSLCVCVCVCVFVYASVWVEEKIFIYLFSTAYSRVSILTGFWEGWQGTGRDGVGWDGMGWDGVGG